MPSSAYNVFRNNLLNDVDMLIQKHHELRTGSRGRHNLGYLTRSALFLLCAGWEYYIELVCRDFLEMIIKNKALVKSHANTKKFLTIYVKNQTDDDFIVQFVQHGWEKCFRDALELRLSQFNTPKYYAIKKLFYEVFGIEISNALDASRKQLIDGFVTKRGKIAHQGAKATYPTINQVIRYRNAVCTYIMSIDEYLALQGRAIYHKQAWCKISKATRIQDYRTPKSKS